MIKIENLNKTYCSKKGQKVEALKMINISFKNNGLVFFLGASGSGKTTLLNLLGGIDVPTSGRIIIDGQDFSSLRSVDYDNYRNNYVGFIFQDFNVINDLTVFENIKVACFEKDEKIVTEKINQTLISVGLGDLKDRFPYEISGGQIQRLAIARALIRDSKIILADEPTGNLDKKTSKEIIELLKKIATEKLVIVVSHNEKIAEEYGERVVRLEDGEIISDSCPFEITENKNSYIRSKKSYISNSIALKMAFHNILIKKLKFFMILLIMTICFMAISTAFVFVDYDRSYVDYKNIINCNEDYISLQTSKYSNTDRVSIGVLNQILKDKPYKYIINNYVTGYNDLISAGYEFYDGYIDLTFDGVYLSENLLETLFSRGDIVLNKETGEPINRNDYTNDMLTGFYTKDLFGVNDNYYLICGVYKNPIKYDFQNDIDYEKYDRYNFYYEKIYPTFCLKNSLLSYSNSTLNRWFPSNNSYNAFSLESEANGYKVYINNNIHYPHYINTSSIIGDVVLTDSNIVYDGALSSSMKFNDCADNEIYLSLELYNKVFNEIYKWEHYISKLEYDFFEGKLSRKILHFPKHIGEKISFIISDNSINNSEIVIKDMVLKGIILNSSDPGENGSDFGFLISESKGSIVYEFTRFNNIIILSSSISDKYSFFKDIKDKYELLPLYTYTDKITEYEDSILIFKFVFKVLSMILIVTIVLLNFSLIGQSVKSREKENGIFRAIGIKKKDIFKIYIFQSLISSTFIYIFVLVMSFLIIKQIDKQLISNYSRVFSIIFYKYWYAVVFLILVFGLNIISSFLALLKSITKNPINIIKA